MSIMAIIGTVLGVAAILGALGVGLVTIGALLMAGECEAVELRQARDCGRVASPELLEKLGIDEAELDRIVEAAMLDAIYQIEAEATGLDPNDPT